MAMVSSRERSASSRRPMLHSTVARKVRWRSGMSTGAGAEGVERGLRPAQRAGIEQPRSGPSPARWPAVGPPGAGLISATAAAFARREREVVAHGLGPVDEQQPPAVTPPAWLASTVLGSGGKPSGGTAYSRSARSRSATREVARMVTPGQRASSALRSCAASTTCSRLSRMSSHRSFPKWSTRACSGDSGSRHLGPDLAADPGQQRLGAGRRRERDERHTPREPVGHALAHGQREPGLADPAGAGEGHQPRARGGP